MRTAMALVAAICLVMGTVAVGQQPVEGRSQSLGAVDPYKEGNQRHQGRVPDETPQIARPTAARIPFSTAARQQRLHQQLDAETKVQFIDTPLEEVAGYLKQLHNVLILLDSPSINEVLEPTELQITMNLEGISLRTAFNLIADQYRLGWYTQDGVLIITSADKAEQQMTTQVYSLHGLSAEGLEEAILATVQPTSWVTNGGQGELAILSSPNALVVRQNQKGHDELKALLQTLEALSTEGRSDPPTTNP